MVIAFVLASVILPSPVTQPPRLDAYGDRLPATAVARFGTVRWRSPDPPKHLIWSPDGKFLVTTHGNDSLTIWAYPSGIATGRFETPALLRERKSVFIRAMVDCTITPEQIRFDPDGRSMLIYARDNQLYRVHLPDARWERLHSGDHAGDAIALSRDGRRLLLETLVPRSSMERWSELTLVDRDRPNRRTVLGNRPVMLPARGWQRLEDFLAPDSCLSADGRFVAMGFLQPAKESRVTAPETGRIAVIDLATGKSRVCDGPSVRELRMSPDSKMLIAIHTDMTLSTWQLGESPELTSTPPATRIGSRGFPFGTVESISFTPDSRRLIVIGDRTATKSRTEWTVVVLDARSLREARRWTFETSEHPWYWVGNLRSAPRPTVAVSPDNCTVAVSSPLPAIIRFFDVASGKEHHWFGGHIDEVTDLVSPSPGQRLISASADGIGRVWNLERLRALAGPPGAMPTALRGHVGSRTGGVHMPTQSRGHATQFALPSVRESDVLPKLEAGDLPEPQSSRFKVLYDGRHNRMELRNAATDDLLRVYDEDAFAGVEEAHRPKTLPVALSPSEEWFAYAVLDRVVVRALDSGQTLATFNVELSKPTAVASIPGTDLVAVGYHDGQILVWDLLPRDIPRTPPSAREYERLWLDLGGDVQSATRARAIMLAHHGATVAAIRERAKPFASPTDFDIDSWIVRLTHARYAERERAARELRRHFELAAPAMREVLASTRSLEMRERLQRILEGYADPVADAEELRLLRAAAILERIGTPEAHKELLRLARGGGRPAERAADGLVRMKERKKEWATLRPMRGIW